MVSISKETSKQTAQRLEKVIQQAKLIIYPNAYIFEEFALNDFCLRANGKALALVRDDKVWSQLIEQSNSNAERFAIWRFHFPEGADNSGFVGWLAMHLKTQFGTGVFVVCGQNSSDGGIFDYWGCPWSLRDEVTNAVQQLVDNR